MNARAETLEKTGTNLEKVTVNFIYNRFDLFDPVPEYELIKIVTDDSEKIIEYSVNGDKAELGIWMTPLSDEEMKAVLRHIHVNHPKAETVTYRNGLINYGHTEAHNHFRIEFPDTVEEFENRLSHKSLKKLNKRIRKVEEELGKINITEYEGESIPPEAVSTFFEFKKEIYGREYYMTADEYLKRYHVSHCYIMTVGDTVGAVRFACEQCPVVNGENFSYRPELRPYALGRIIFHYHLKLMVEKHHPRMFLSGGNWEYKTHYGSIEDTVYDGTIYQWEETFGLADGMYKGTKKFLKEHLPDNTFGVLKKIKHKIGG